MTYHIKTATLDEVKELVDWAGQEGWNPGLCDAETFYNIDPSGFFVGYDNNEMVSGISMVKYDSDFCFAGFYIVTPDERGKGYGMQITQHALSYAGNANIGSDGVLEQVDNYKKIGFASAYKNSRFRCQPNDVWQKSFENVEPVTPELLTEVLKYDEAFFPADRRAFIRAWINMKNAKAFCYHDKKVRGYGVIRKCVEGYKVGPLFADTFSIAKALFQTLCNTASKDSFVLLDIPEINPWAVKLVNEFKMSPVFATIRMYTKPEPDIAISRTFGVTTFEVG